MFIAKDGFLLYYGERTNPNASHYDTKPKARGGEGGEGAAVASPTRALHLTRPHSSPHFALSP
jgi:hypothetical protein